MNDYVLDAVIATVISLKNMSFENDLLETIRSKYRVIKRKYFDFNTLN